MGTLEIKKKQGYVSWKESFKDSHILNPDSTTWKDFFTQKNNQLLPRPELIQLDPNIETINQPETFYSFDSSHCELIVCKEKKENIIAHNLKLVCIKSFTVKPNFIFQNRRRSWQSNIQRIYQNKSLPFVHEVKKL